MILIAGCNGHVGREIVRKAVARGVPARCFDVVPLEISGTETSGLEIVTGDITDPEAVRKAVQGVDVAMFVIGLKRETEKITHEMVECGGMRNLVAAAKNSGVRHIIYISVMGVAPDAPANSLAAKWKAEQVLQNSGITYTIFRPSGYFVDFAEHFAPKIRETGSFTLIGGGRTRIEPLDPADLAEAFMQCIDNEKVYNKIYKIAGPEEYTLADIVRLVGRVVNTDVKIKNLPFWLMNMMFSLIALLTGKRGAKDFLYRMSRDSVCSPQDRDEIRKAFSIDFKRLEPWLHEQLT